jgi:uncharacterized protein YjbI with pentapeptide repeats
VRGDHHMANQEYLAILKQGVDVWNTWRDGHPDIRPDLSYAQFMGADLSGANLYDTNLIGANLIGANLTEANLIGAKLSGADLTGAKLSRTDLNEADLTGAKLGGADLAGADLAGADLAGADLTGANLSRTRLSIADLSRANLSGADLSGANLSRADLSGANLSRADLIAADLSRADLSRADLSRADLSRANLNNSNLSEANLSRAYLGETNLSGANLRGTDLSEADLSEPTYLGAEPLRPGEVQFTAFHPALATVNTWQTLLVYVSLASALSAVQADAARFRDELGPLPQTVHALAQSFLAAGTILTIVPQCQGITFNPPFVSFRWLEEWYRVIFRFQTNRELAKPFSSGEIYIYAGPLLIGILKLSLLFVQQGQLPATVRSVQETAGIYQRMFVSYSHDDRVVVQRCRNMYRALGLTILMDQDTLRSGQVWSHALEQMIETADVFQLFWSKRAAASRYVRQEWEYALGRNKGEGFIRPVYWETPLVPPPPELAKLHFAYLPPDTFGSLPRQWARNLTMFALPLIGGLILLFSSLSLLIHREDFALIVGIDILLVIVILLAILLGRRVR